MVISSRQLKWVTFSLALCVASGAMAQGNLEAGKTAAQLFASNCAGCHNSPQTVPGTDWNFGLESFLREHYTTGPESAAALAAYLKAEVSSKGHVSARRSGQATIGQASSPQAMSSGFMEEEIPRPPADIPDVKPSHR